MYLRVDRVSIWAYIEYVSTLSRDREYRVE